MKVAKDKSIKIYDFCVYADEEINVKDVQTRLGATFSTPIGKIRLEETPVGIEDFCNEEITVTKYPLNVIAARYAGRLSVSMADKESTILNLSMNDEV